MKVILDTNFLLIPGQLGIDVFVEIEKACDFRVEYYMMQESVDELNKIIKEQPGKPANNAKLGLELLKKKRVTFIKGEENQSVDDNILAVAERGESVVATQDRLLKAKLKTKDIKILTLRQKKYVRLEG